MNNILFGKAPVLTNNAVLKKISIAQFVKLLKTSKQLKKVTDDIRKCKDVLEKKRLKKQTLDYILPFNYKKLVRNQANFISAEYMIFEADGVTNPAKELLKIKKDSRILVSYISVSNNGYKFMVKLNAPITKEHYYRAYNYFKNMFNNEFDIELDPANNDMARVQFLCYDTKVYFNPKAKPVDVKEIVYQLNLIDENYKGHYEQEFLYDIDEVPKAIDYIHKHGYHDLEDESVWWRLSMSLASLGEEGRKHFLHLSCDHPLYPKDTKVRMNKKFDHLLQQHGRYHDENRVLSINSFFHIAKTKFNYRIKQSSKRAIELLLANEFYEQYKDLLIYDHSKMSSGKLYSWYIWNNKTYVAADRGEVSNLYIQFLEKKKKEVIASGGGEDDDTYGVLTLSNISRAETKRYRDLTLDWASTKPNFAIKPDELDMNLDLFNTESGILNFITGNILKHDQGFRMTKISPVKYIKKSKCHAWEAFLDKLFFSNSNIINYIQEAVGYSLTGNISEQCLFFLYGTGANGKSTFLEAIKHIAGDYATHANYETFTANQKDGSNHSEDVVRLRGARMVTTSEINTNKSINESLIKSMTGGDKITARALHSSSIEFTPNFKIWIAGNHKPKLNNFDIGIRRRFHIIPFNYRFRQDEIRPQSEILNEFEAEDSGILSWCIKGAERWYRRGKLSIPIEVEEETQKYFKESNIIEQFLDDLCVLSPAEKCPALDLFNEYFKYSNENHEQPMGRNKFYGRLEELGFTRSRDSAAGKQIVNGMNLKVEEKLKDKKHSNLI